MSKANKVNEKAPAWVMTFADLMSLLLAFFVLLFSFSELDKAKYKEVAGSLRDAFGVQQEIRTRDPPKGINIIAREFSPAVPEPTPRNEVRQYTTEDSLPYPVLHELEKAFQISTATRRQLEDKKRLEEALKPEIDAGLVELEMNDNRIVVRIKEKGVFPSGSDRLERNFMPIMQRLADTLTQTSGKIVIAGHTDNIPIENSRFRSNWELSVGRAMTVARVFFDRSTELGHRVHLEAYGEHRPIDTNETPEGRARNRRVELSLVYRPDARARARGWQGATPEPREVEMTISEEPDKDSMPASTPGSTSEETWLPWNAVGPTHTAEQPQ